MGKVRTVIATTVTATAAIAVPGVALAAVDAGWSKLSEDGSTVVFVDDERLLSEDADSGEDVYRASGGELTLVSEGGGSAADAQRVSVSGDGETIAFVTDESLLSEDGNAENDAYVAEGDELTLLTPGPSDETPRVSVSVDGTRVFFETEEALDPLDTDDRVDGYVFEDGESSVLTSNGTAGNGEFDIAARGPSSDGSSYFFYTKEPLVAGDTDTGYDAYRRRVDGSIRLLSKGPGTGNAGAFSGLSDYTADGDLALVESDEQLVAADTDNSRDAYLADGTGVTLISGGTEEEPANLYIAGERDGGLSEDGSTAVFTTAEPLLGADGDSEQDVYAWIDGTLTLISDREQAGADADEAAIPLGMGGDGNEIPFVTSEPLVAADTDSVADFYRWREGDGLTLMTPDTDDAVLTGRLDESGETMLFTTAESLLGSDTDAVLDVYLRLPGAGTALASISEDAGNGAFPVQAPLLSPDGSRTLYATEEAMVPRDVDGGTDLYEYVEGDDPVLLSGELVPPETELTKTPAAKKKQGKKKKKAKFKFSSEPDASFECQKDKGKSWKPCESPYKKKYKAGKRSYKKHVFKVRATDAAGNREAKAEKFVFKRKLKKKK